jgi:hypothetical protein
LTFPLCPDLKSKISYQGTELSSPTVTYCRKEKQACGTIFGRCSALSRHMQALSTFACISRPLAPFAGGELLVPTVVDALVETLARQAGFNHRTCIVTGVRLWRGSHIGGAARRDLMPAPASRGCIAPAAGTAWVDWARGAYQPWGAASGFQFPGPTTARRSAAHVDEDQTPAVAGC